MRVARLRATAEEDGPQRFEDAMSEHDLAFEPSRLSRWEYGRARGTARLVRAYEIGCLLPPYLLFAVNDRRARGLRGAFAATPSVAASDLLVIDDIHDIIDRTLAGEDVSGSDWYQFASFATAGSHFYLSRRDMRIVARRLMEELARSIGPAYILRYEALHLLASLPRLQAAFVAELMAQFENEATGAIGDAISLILRTAPPVRREFFASMSDSTSPALRHGAVWMADLLRDRKRHWDTPLRPSPIFSVTDSLREGLPKWAMAHIECDMTGPLLSEAIGGHSRIKRHEAALILMLAGIGDHLSERLLDLLQTGSNRTVRRRLAHLLEYQVPVAQPDRILALAAAEADPVVGRSLWVARGHAGKQFTSSEAVTAALRCGSTEYGVTYALGMSGSVDEAMLANGGLSPHQRRNLTWWYERGPALFR